MPTPAPGTPFRLLLLGDFSGRSARGVRQPLADRRPLRLDAASLPSVLARFDARLPSPFSRDEPLRFRGLDDFRPERLFEAVEAFGPLRELRARVADPATFADPPPAPRPRAPAAAKVGDPVAAFLEQSRGADAPTASSWRAYLDALVRPPRRPRVNHSQQAEALARVDEAVGDALRLLLHEPAFQALEAAWRGAAFLVRRLDPDTELSVWLLDVSRDEALADLAGAPEPRRSGLGRLLAEPAEAPYAAAVALYSFGPTPADVQLLPRLAALAAAAGVPLLAAAEPAAAGAATPADLAEPADWRPAAGDAAEVWSLVRNLPAAPSLALALPRFLLRLPYGRDTTPVEGFDFEELPAPQPEAYLWGNPALVAATLLGCSFRRAGWDLRPGMAQELDGLPVHVVREDGEGRLRPCVETVLNDRAAGALLAEGLMPLMALPGRDAVVMPRFRTFAQDDRPLAAWWM